MRTTLDLPEALVLEAREALGYKSKTDTIIFALRQVVRDTRLEQLKALFGRIEFDIDPTELRGKERRRVDRS
jgi:Arc/MetJ family transcription regulator